MCNKRNALDELAIGLPDFRYRKNKIWQGAGTLAGEPQDVKNRESARRYTGHFEKMCYFIRESA